MPIKKGRQQEKCQVRQKKGGIFLVCQKVGEKGDLSSRNPKGCGDPESSVVLMIWSRHHDHKAAQQYSETAPT